MSDRLTEIRARLDALNAAPPFSLKWQEQLHRAPADIAWLLYELDEWKRLAEHRKRLSELPSTCTVCGRSVSECGDD